MTHARRRTTVLRGFTLTELLVVVIIIVILVSILIPSVSKILDSAREAKTKAFISQLEGAIETYHLDFRAYPGPLPNNMIANSAATATTIVPNASFPGGFHVIATAAGYNTTDFAANDYKKITASENLVLGLLGGLRIDLTGPTLRYDPSQIGLGPMELGIGPTKRHSPYLTVNLDTATSLRKNAAGLLSGSYSDEAGQANDTIIPEFVDGFTNPLPILYMRAKVSGAVATYPLTYNNNGIVTYDPAETDASAAGARPGQYDLHQIIGYTGTSIGVGKNLPEVSTAGDGTMVNWKNNAGYHGLTKCLNGGNNLTVLSINQLTQIPNSKYYFPYDAYAYFRNFSASALGADNTFGTSDDVEVAKQKDSYILISAGKDRVYGTDDDITNFGVVGP